jgi:hypothetical protein
MDTSIKNTLIVHIISGSSHRRANELFTDVVNTSPACGETYPDHREHFSTVSGSRPVHREPLAATLGTSPVYREHLPLGTGNYSRVPGTLLHSNNHFKIK